jgi:hypothetical protein
MANNMIAGMKVKISPTALRRDETGVTTGEQRIHRNKYNGHELVRHGVLFKDGKTNFYGEKHIIILDARGEPAAVSEINPLMDWLNA